MLGIGLFACHKGYIKTEAKEFLTKILVNLGIPAVAIINILEKFPRDMLSDMWLLFIIPFGAQVVCIAIATLLATILKLRPKRRSLFINMCSLSNAIFIGMPVCFGIFGEESTPYVMVYYIVNTLFFWGYSTPNMKMEAEGGVYPLKQRIQKTLSVPLMSCILAFILLMFDFRLPSIASTVLGFFSNSVTTLSLLLISRIIYENGVKNIRFDLSVVLILFMRFLVSPVIMYLASSFFGLSDFVSQVYTVQMAMPVMITTAVLAEAYKSDSPYASSALIITTFLSLMIIPFYVFIMN